jgi:hypothetical protein
MNIAFIPICILVYVSGAVVLPRAHTRICFPNGTGLL